MFCQTYVDLDKLLLAHPDGSPQAVIALGDPELGGVMSLTWSEYPSICHIYGSPETLRALGRKLFEAAGIGDEARIQSDLASSGDPFGWDDIPLDPDAA